MDIYCMPLEPGAFDRPLCGDRRRSGYGAKWSTTERELAEECARLGADEVVIGLAVTRDQIRLDGWPKSGVDVPDEVAIYLPRSEHGSLRWLSDRWWGWRDNVRAVVLVLQRLRWITESGVASAGEQYKGWAALPPGRPGIGAGLTVEVAVELLKSAASQATPGREFIVLPGDNYSVTTAYKHAVRAAHPDKPGGDAEAFARLTAARDLLLAAAS